MTELNEEKSNKIEEKKNQFFLSKETQESLKKLIPKISIGEVMSCESQESKAADKMLLSFGKNMGKFSSQENLNTAMKILFFIGMKKSFEGEQSKYSIFEGYCKNFEPLSWEKFEDLLSKLTGRSILNPLQNIGEVLKLTSMGKFLVHTYQKLKLETIAMKRYGVFEDLFVMVEMIRSFISFDQYGLELNWIYGLMNALKDFVESLKREGNTILEDPDIDEKIREIHKLIDQILEFQNKDVLGTSSLTIQHHVQISSSIFDAVIQLLNIASAKYDFNLAKSRGGLLETPFIKMQEFILNNLVTKNWQEIFFNCNKCAIPVQYPMKINSYYVKRALINVLQKVEDTEFEELPEAPSPILEEKSFIENIVEKSDLIPLKEELLEKAIKFKPEEDYTIVKNKKPRSFLENLLMFYTLSFEQKIQLDNKFRIINDSKRHIEKFTARKYNIIEDKSMEGY